MIKIRKDGDKFAVSDCWHGTVQKDHSLATLISEGFKAIGGDESTFIAVGGDSTGWGQAEVTMPMLKGPELKNALSFELRKHSPFPIEKLKWGYRLLNSDKKNAKQHLQLIYIRSEKWTKWIELAGALHCADLICPPQALISSLFTQGDIIIPDGIGNATKYSLDETSWQSEKINLPASFNLEQAFPNNFFNLACLSKYPSEEQLDFIPCLLLGAYALTSNATADIETLPRLPESLIPHRNSALKIISACLGVFIVLVLALGLARQFQQKNAHIRTIDSAIQEIENQRHLLQSHNKSSEKALAQTLRQEMQDNAGNGPDLPDVLAEVSSIIEAPAWISQRFEWNNGLVTIQIQSTSKDVDLAMKLEDSPVIGDVREQSSAFRQNAYITRYTFNARYDTPEEAEALKVRKAAAAEAARERALKQQQEERAQKQALQETPAEPSEIEGEPEQPDDANNIPTDDLILEVSDLQ